MCLLFETIKVIDGVAHNLDLHTHRMNRSRKELLGLDYPINLYKEITIPEEFRHGIYKLRIEYSEKLASMDFTKYQMRNIKTLKIIECDDMDYSYKYVDRALLESLFSRKGDSDDILILKNGSVTDTSFTNIVFYDGEKWLTPSTPLLKGTKREKLLTEGRIFEREIMVDDLSLFVETRLINAMIDLEDELRIDIIQ